MKLIITFILFICVTVINGLTVITLDGRCPFNDLKPSPLAVVPVLKGKSNLIARSIVEKQNRTDVVTLFQPSGPDQLKITERFQSLETGLCGQIENFFNATSTPGVFDTQYEIASGTVSPFKLFFLSDGTHLKSVVFSCQNVSDEKFQFSIVVLSAFTKDFGKKERDYTKRVMDSNNIGSLYKYVTESKHSTGKSPCGFSPEEVLKSSSPVQV